MLMDISSKLGNRPTVSNMTRIVLVLEEGVVDGVGSCINFIDESGVYAYINSVWI